VTSVPEGGGVPAWTLNNHDVHRSVSRYGLTDPEPMDTDDAHARTTRARGTVDVELGLRRARAAALLLLALPGSAYLYQGEELGLPEVMDLPDGARRDPIWSRSQGREHGRDGSRVPMPWTPNRPTFGFSPADATADPWLPQPDWFADYAESTQDGSADSTLSLYRAALALRRTLFGGAGFAWLDAGRPDVLAFRHAGGISVTNMGTEPFTVPGEWGEIVLRSAPGHELAPGTGAWLTAR
jgi:alpha-glucosidase